MPELLPPDTQDWTMRVRQWLWCYALPYYELLPARTDEDIVRMTTG